jgi:glycosyltransferase involved in cell wall biosynthesis
VTIRVLLIAPSLAIVGGQSVQADRLLRAFAGDTAVQLTLRRIDSPLPASIRRIPYLRTLCNAVVYYAGLVGDVAGADVVHAFTSSFWGYTLWIIPAGWLARWRGRRMIVNYRDGRAEEHLREWPSAAATLRRADAVVTPSPYLAEVFRRHGLEAQVIPNAIDLKAFRYRERAMPGPVFLTNRGLEPLYDVASALRAFRLIQDRYPEATFVVANDGPLRGELEALARALGLRRVTFAGAVGQARMAELYDAADIYVMSPTIDNMPGTVLECFASGLPVVSTRAGGVPYVAEHDRTALLTPIGDPEALAAASVRLMEEPGLALRLTREAYRECAGRYACTAVREQWTRLYTDLMASSHAAPQTLAVIDPATHHSLKGEGRRIV